jgi:hypothetical protein
VSPSGNLFQIPYNQGWTEVNQSDVEWTSEYPELVWCIFSFQYIRARTGSEAAAENAVQGEKTDILTDPGDKQIRAQIKVSIDDTLYDGSGPFALPIDQNYRGTGYRNRCLASSVCVVTELPAGAHRIVAMAAQRPCVKVNDGINSSTDTYLTDPPNQGVAIGNRHMIVCSFANGGRLGA